MENIRSQREPLLTASSNIDDKGMLRKSLCGVGNRCGRADKIEIDCYLPEVG
jgi:hypothetical protein